MSEENFDDHDSSDGEDNKKAYESILSNPSYFSVTMKVNFILHKLKRSLNFSHVKFYL